MKVIVKDVPGEKFIDVTSTLTGPSRDPADAIIDVSAFMATRDHWTRLWPDPRERFRWLRWINRVSALEFWGWSPWQPAPPELLTTPRLSCADGVSRRFTATGWPGTPMSLAVECLRLAGRNADAECSEFGGEP